MQHTSVASKQTLSLVRVMVVDDHRTFAEALGLAIGMENGLEAVVASSGAEAIEMAGREQPDVILVDMEMPGMSGIDTIRRLLEAVPEARVVVVSGHEDDLIKARALEAGAVGYISKGTPLEEIPGVVRRAHRREEILPGEEQARLLRILRHRRHQESTERQRANRLTPRQIEILQLLAEGLAPPEIAGQLHLSPFTLRTHVQNILTRLGVHTKVEALALAIRHGKIKAEG